MILKNTEDLGKGNQTQQCLNLTTFLKAGQNNIFGPSKNSFTLLPKTK